MIAVGDKVRTRYGEVGVVKQLTDLGAILLNEDPEAYWAEMEKDLPYLICEDAEGNTFEVCEYNATLLSPDYKGLKK